MLATLGKLLHFDFQVILCDGEEEAISTRKRRPEVWMVRLPVLYIYGLPYLQKKRVVILF